MKDGSICDKCKHVHYCDMSDERNNDNVAIKGCYLYAENTSPETNEQRITLMTRVELAKFLAQIQADAYNCGLLETQITSYPNNKYAWMEWLGKETDET